MDDVEDNIHRSFPKHANEVQKDRPLLTQIFQYWDALSSISERVSEEELLGKKKRRTRRKDGNKRVPTLSQVQRELFGTEDQGKIRNNYKAHFLAKGNRAYVKGAKLLGDIGDDAVNVLRRKGLSGQGVHWQLQELLNISELSPEFIRRKVLNHSKSREFDLRFDALVWEEYFLEQPQEKWSSRFKLYMKKKKLLEDHALNLFAGGTAECHKAATENTIQKLSSWTISGLSFRSHLLQQNASESILHIPSIAVPSSLGGPVGTDAKAITVRAVAQVNVPPKKHKSSDPTEVNAALLSQQFLDLSKNIGLSAAKKMQYIWASSVFQSIGTKGIDCVTDAASIWLEDWYADWGKGRCQEDRIVIRALGAHPSDRLRLSEKDIELVRDGNQLKFVPNELLQFIVTNCFAWDCTVRENLFWISDLTPVWNIVVSMSENEIDNRTRRYYKGLWERGLAIIPVQHGDGLWSVAVILNLNTIEDFVHSGPFPSTESRAQIRYFGPVKEARMLQKRMLNILIQTLPGRKYHLDEKYRNNISIAIDEKIMEGFDIGGSPCGLEGNMYNVLRIIYVLLEDIDVWKNIAGPESALYFFLERVCISHIFRVVTVGVTAARTMATHGLIFEACQPSASFLLTELREKNALEACGVDLGRIFSRQGMENFLSFKEEEVRKLQETVSLQCGEISRLTGIVENTNGLYIQNMKDKGRLYSSDDGSKMLMRELDHANESLKRKNIELNCLKKRIEELELENTLKKRRLSRMKEQDSFFKEGSEN